MLRFQKYNIAQYRYLTVFLLIVFTAMNSACDAPIAEKKRSARSLPVVEVAQAEMQLLNHTLTLTGTLQPRRTIHVYNQAPGMLLKLPYYQGDSVQAGDLLAQLDDTIIKADYNKAHATLKQAQIDYGRLQKLAKNNLTSKELLERANTKIRLDQSDYNLQQKRLSYTRIKAPWQGVISERLVESGDVLPLHTHFMSLIDISNLKMTLSLSELHISQIKIGDTIHYQIDALGKQTWSGEIERIFPEINAQTRKGIVELKLTPVPEGAKPGQLARIHLLTAKENVLVIPLSGIRYDQQGAYVFVVNNDMTIQRTNIITGKKYAQQMEILEGLNINDMIVQKGLFGLRSGKKVNILNTKAD
ncbi:MAG: efflux RND transporter periplasmic adaptor subunit [Gammaproteobacteria bacterium]|nr:efflux RND transporter periplasmic adaptor subunit [Gammaproteobacteria bacterium]